MTILALNDQRTENAQGIAIECQRLRRTPRRTTITGRCPVLITASRPASRPARRFKFA
jgi:hypothetical protein